MDRSSAPRANLCPGLQRRRRDDLDGGCRRRGATVEGQHRRAPGGVLVPAPQKRRTWAMAFGPDFRTVVTGDALGRTTVWDAVQGSPISWGPLHESSVGSAALS